MPKAITMTFWREDYTGRGCLEFSWVPEGHRHVIVLPPRQQMGSETYTIPDDLNPSHVQVYRLDNNNLVSTEMWMFPPGPPYPHPVDWAEVRVYDHNREANGTVHYADGTAASDRRPLDPFGRPCPEIPPSKG